MSGNPLRSCQMEEGAVGVATGEKSGPLIERLGIGRRTLVRWKARDDFRRRVTELRTEMTRESCGRLATKMTEAADALSTLLNTDNERVKLRAAGQLLALGTKLRETVDIEERIQLLEDNMLKR